MPYGGWNGAAEGLKTGVMLGNQFNETQIKRDALLEEQKQTKIEQYSKLALQNATTLKQTIEGMRDRSDPRAAQIIDTLRDQAQQTNKILGTISPQMGQHFEQLISTVYSSTKDQNTQATDAALSKKTTDDAQIDQAVNAKFGPEGTAPTAGAQAPAGPAAPPPGPAMAAPEQQVAGVDQPLPWQQQEPQAGLTSQATAEPMPAMPMPTPAATPAPPVGGPAPAPMAGPAPAAAPAPQISERDAYRNDLIARRAEAAFPPTAMQQGMTAGRQKEFFELRPTIAAAEKAIKTNQRARQLLKEGIYTGWTATAGLIGSKVTGSDKEMVKRTEEFQALLGSGIGQQLKQFGSATAVSNLDLKTVEQYIGKDITLNKESLEAILRMNEDGARSTINYFNKYVAPGVGEKTIELPPEEDGSSGFKAGPDGRIQLGPNTFLKVLQ
jgi:hypothetical protein